MNDKKQFILSFVLAVVIMLIFSMGVVYFLDLVMSAAERLIDRFNYGKFQC